MKPSVNIGTVDRALRIGIGALLIGLSLSGVIGWWGWIGVVPLGPAWCASARSIRCSALTHAAARVTAANATAANNRVGRALRHFPPCPGGGFSL